MKTIQEIEDLGFKLEVVEVNSKNVKVTFSPGESRMTVKIPNFVILDSPTWKIIGLYVRRQFSHYEGVRQYLEKKTVRTSKPYAMVCNIVEKEGLE